VARLRGRIIIIRLELGVSGVREDQRVVRRDLPDGHARDAGGEVGVERPDEPVGDDRVALRIVLTSAAVRSPSRPTRQDLILWPGGDESEVHPARPDRIECGSRQPIPGSQEGTMARSGKTTDKPTAGRRPIEQYDHKGKERNSNPPVGLVTEATDRDAPRKRYAYDPHLDPTLTWAGKAEHTSFAVKIVDDRGIESLKVIQVP
jgi:hypothetical protein